MRRLLHAAIVLSLFAEAAAWADKAPSPAPVDYDAPIKRWREGPVRYLLTRQESATYRGLKTLEERRDFIRKFWARLDPDPATPQNEYRALFQRRVAEADRSFLESTTPGWKTDRGRVYILVGPPDDIDVTRGPRSLQPDLILWTYRDPPPGLGLATNAVIRFARETTGEYRIANRALLGRFESAMAVGFQTQAMLIKSLPEQHKVLDLLPGSSAFLDEPFVVHADFFPSTRGTLVVLTLAVRAARLEGDPSRAPDPGTLQAVARLVAEAPPQAVYDLAGEAGLRPDPGGPAEDGSMMFQGGVTVPPGTYTVYLAAVEPGPGRHYPHRQVIQVPDLDRSPFEVGPLTLARSLEMLPGRRTDYSAPFVLGSMRAVPRLDDRIGNGEEFACYFQVRGASADPIDGLPDLDVEYEFAVARSLDPEGRPDFAPIGEPVRLTRLRSRLQSYAFVLKDWQPANYRVQVTVRDNLEGREASASTTFRVE